MKTKLKNPMPITTKAYKGDLGEPKRDLVSRFGIGEGVILDTGNNTYKFAFVRAVIFSASKVRYSLWLPSMETTLHNVDSVFVAPDPEPKFKDFGEDNYS